MYWLVCAFILSVAQVHLGTGVKTSSHSDQIKQCYFYRYYMPWERRRGKKKKRTAKRKQSQTMFMKSIERIHFTSKDMSLQSARNINIPYFCRYIHTSFVKNSNIIRVKLIGFARLLTEAVKLHYVSKA